MTLIAPKHPEPVVEVIKKPPVSRIIIVIKNNNVHNIMSDEPIRAVVLDYDTEQSAPEDVTYIPQKQCQPDLPALVGEMTVEEDTERVQLLYDLLGK